MIDDALWQTIADGLLSYLDRQRWYADKLRPISALNLLDLADVETPRGRILLALIGIDYLVGDSRRYFVPMTVHSDPTPERFTIGNWGSYWIQDAIGDTVFHDFLAQGGVYGSEHGMFRFESWTIGGVPFQLDPATQSSATSFEQSNSSIAYGEEVIAKLYRRLEIGQNIEIDLNRYLTTEAGFASVPTLIAAASYQGTVGNIPLMIAQQHVGDHRDAWTALTDLLRHKANGSLELIEGLGRVTGELHVAFASAPSSSPLAPEPITDDVRKHWRDAFLRSAADTDWITAERLEALPARSQQAAREYSDSARDWQERSTWFDLLEGLYRTRVHGDYHLGQVLVTRDGRLLIVDFEGEPQRPAHEREAKYSPLRDVAGMLRSLNYATGVVASSHDVQAVADSRSWLEHWERDARVRFLTAYRKAIAASPLPVAPRDEDAFTKLLSVLETEKAFYEVRYELNSRPDWAWLPLDSLK